MLNKTDNHPMRRSDSLEVFNSHVECSYCSHCYYGRDTEYDMISKCLHPEKVVKNPWGEGMAPTCKDSNPEGLCKLFKPSFLTKILRFFGKRKPMLIEIKERTLDTTFQLKDAGRYY